MSLAEAAEGAVLCWLATVDGDGQPSVSPKELWSVADAATLVIADVASGGSVRAIRAAPRVCVSFIDIFRQTGLKAYGTARLLAPDAPGFATLGAEVLAAAGDTYPVRHLIVVDVSRTAPIRAPSYHLKPGMSVADRMAEAMTLYGVRPR